ncbi:MAG: hypothetical protein A2826_02770 [Candidatus Doudnabacteria bacterium RIFCSPHIGHO2_01_FULL_43_23]|uniref:NodB homology domain-containing protein n=1 Tax=Candidatus Doudnabacteria bacterium RIFCSPHIGHO2_01_FULL_43_23 TaxID=1817822 RepID=A0A1F5NS18_9BACT|nr:MAG: hypothetical protein A2826_02770 [Candidatus Doudnabacteria bacterium RIFCSPHIGHO2_01_FULL_43_23]
MKLVIVCHLENDLSNESGIAKKLPQEKQSFAHIPMILEWFSGMNIPLTLAVMVGGQTGTKLLESQSLKAISKNDNLDIGIHYHAEKFIQGSWIYQTPLNEQEYRNYFAKFENVVGISPKSAVFGKWKIDPKAYPVFKALNITHDGSKIPEKGIISIPSLVQGIIEVPSVSYDGRPVNPLTRISDFFLMKKILQEHYAENLLLHLAFHSYDLFSFSSGAPKWLTGKKSRLMALINLSKTLKLEIIKLKDCNTEISGDLSAIKLPFLARIGQLLGH